MINTPQNSDPASAGARTAGADALSDAPSLGDTGANASAVAPSVEPPETAMTTPHDLTVVDANQVDQIHRHLEDLFRARKASSPFYPRDRYLVAGSLACIAYTVALFCGIHIATATGHVLRALLSLATRIYVIRLTRRR